MPSPEEQDPRIFFAAERTLLAWIRTGVALMGFGFAIARFGLFIRQLQAAEVPGHAVNTGIAGSPFSGVALIVVGVLINLVAPLQYMHTVRRLKENRWIPSSSRMGVAVAALLAVLGIAMAAYLLRLL